MVKKIMPTEVNPEIEALFVQSKVGAGEFFDSLWERMRQELDKPEKKLPEMLLTLSKEYDVDLCGLAINAIRSGKNIFRVMSPLDSIFERLKLNVDSLINLLELLYEKAQGGGVSHYIAITKIAMEQPEFARLLLTTLLTKDDPYIIVPIANIYSALSKGNEEKIHSELLELNKEQKSVPLTNAIISALGSLNYSVEHGDSLLTLTMSVCIELEEKNSTEINRYLISCYGEVQGKSSLARERLIKFASLNNENINYSLSRVLLINAKDYSKDGWFKEILIALASTPAEHRGTIDQIDGTLYQILLQNDFEFFEVFLRTWIINAKYKPRENAVSDLFDSSFHLLLDRTQDVEIMITKYFNEDDFRYHEVASDLANYFTLHKGVTLKLNAGILSQFEESDLLYITRKILGYIIESKVQCVMIYSILERKPTTSNIERLVGSAFLQYIIRDYPSSAEKFLREKVSTNKIPGQISVASKLLEEIDARNLTFKALEPLNELKPPSRQTYVVALETQKKMKKAMDKSEGKSALISLMKKIQVRYGVGTFSWVDDAYSPVTKFVSVSASMEMPISERSYPVHAAIERVEFRMLRKAST